MARDRDDCNAEYGGKGNRYDLGEGKCCFGRLSSHDLSSLLSHPTAGFELCLAGLLARGSQRPTAFPALTRKWHRWSALSAYSRGGGFGTRRPSWVRRIRIPCSFPGTLCRRGKPSAPIMAHLHCLRKGETDKFPFRSGSRRWQGLSHLFGQVGDETVHARGRSPEFLSLGLFSRAGCGHDPRHVDAKLLLRPHR